MINVVPRFNKRLYMLVCRIDYKIIVLLYATTSLSLFLLLLRIKLLPGKIVRVDDV